MDSHLINDLCYQWLDAWTGNRPHDLIQFYSDDAFYRDPAKPEGLRGTEQLLKYFTKLLEKNPKWVWTEQEIIPTEKGFVLKWSATIPAGSSVVTTEGLDILELRGDKITRNEVYFDRSVLLGR